MLVTGPSQSVGSIPCGFCSAGLKLNGLLATTMSTKETFRIFSLKFKFEMVTQVSAGVGTDIGLDNLNLLLEAVNRC